MAVQARPHLAAPADARGALVLALVVLAAVCAAAGPAWTLLVSPIAFGVPHVIADVTYLLVRGPRSLRPVAFIAIITPLAILIGLRGVAVTGGLSYPTLEVALGAAAVIVAVVVAPRARPLAAAAMALVCTAAIVAPRAATVVLLHGHNAIAIVIWLGWAGTRVRPAIRTAVVGVAAVVVAAIAAGVLDSTASGSGPLDHDVLARTLAPGLAPIAAARVVAIFAFLQALHYVMWLVAIPHGLGRSRALDPRTWLVLGVAASILPLLAIAGNAAHVREIYLGLVTFHAWLELAIVGYLVVARDRLAG